MKKWLYAAAALLMTACLLTGCGKEEEGNSSASSSPLPSTVPTVSPTPVPAKAKAVLVKADGGLNVRKSASSEGEILGVADDGSMLPLVVETAKDGWYQVHYQGETAFVSAEFAEVKEITLEEYNRLKGGEKGPGTSSGAKESPSPADASSSSSSSPSSASSSLQLSSSESDSEDGE